jgi:Fe/S biogenesis protein NfuA
MDGHDVPRVEPQGDTMSATETSETTEPTAATILEITPTAMETVLGIRSEEPDPDVLGLRVEVTGVKGPEYTYDLAFDELSAVAEDDVVELVGDLSVIVPASSVESLRGAVLDVPRTAGQGGLVIRNPNRPNPLAGVELHLEGTVAEQVQQLLEQSINPSLAAHGGYATLLGVEGDKVYLTMGGGCHGCAMSALTLRQGIERSIKEAIPEVTDVIDATDHAQGENPFYT